MNRLIIVGSPRPDGRSAALADLLFEACIEECPNDELALAPVATLAIEGCQGCDACKALVERIAEADSDSDEVAPRRCIIEDDMSEVYELIDMADEVTVVAPVYFAGAPSQLKALLDRLQPYFWANARKQPKRPAVLHVVGEGGDPHGFEPLVGEVRSSLSCAGFALERVLDWVGKIDEDGEITAEATEHALAPLPGVAAAPQDDELTPAPEPAPPVKRERPTLHVASESKPAPGGGKGDSKQGNRPKQGGSKQNRSKQGGKRRG